MKNNLFKFLYCILILALLQMFSSCSCHKKPKKDGTAETKKVEKAEKSSDVSDFREALDKMTYSGFGYKQIRVLPKAKRDAWVKEHAEDLKKILAKLPEDSILVLKGHASSEAAPDETATISHMGLGMLRAQFLYKLLSSYDVPMEKIKCRSGAEKEPIEGKSASSPANRRVTLYIEKK